MSGASNAETLSGLFTKLHGGKAVPLRFEMTPSAERAEITRIVSLGGGEISAKSSEGSIRLASSDWPVVKSGSVDYRYVLACAKKAKLLDFRQFLLEPKGVAIKSGCNVLPAATRNRSAVSLVNDPSVSSDNTSSVIYSVGSDKEDASVELGADENAEAEAATNSATTATVVAKSAPKRTNSRANRGKHVKRYTFEEDRKLAAYVAPEENASRVRSNTLWIEAEQNDLLPGRSYLSMRDHFLEVILPRIRSFGAIIPAKSMRLLQRKSDDEDVSSPPANKIPLQIVTDKSGTPRRAFGTKSNVNANNQADSFEVHISDPDETQLDNTSKQISTSVSDLANRQRSTDAQASEDSAEIQLLVLSAPRATDAEQQKASSSHLAAENATSDSLAAIMRSDSVENAMCCIDTQEAVTMDELFEAPQRQIDMITNVDSITKGKSVSDPARVNAQQPGAESSVVITFSHSKKQLKTTKPVRQTTRVGAFRDRLAHQIANIDARLRRLNHTSNNARTNQADETSRRSQAAAIGRSSLDDLATQQSEFERALRSMPTSDQSPRTLMCSTQISDVPARTRGRTAATGSFDHAVVVDFVCAPSASPHHRLSDVHSTSPVSTSYRSANTSLCSPHSDDARSQNTSRPTIILAPDSTMFEHTSELPDQSPSTSRQRATPAKIAQASPTRSNSGRARAPTADGSSGKAVLKSLASCDATPQRRSPRSLSASFSGSPSPKKAMPNNDKPAPKKRRRNVSPLPNLEEAERLGRVTRLRAKQIQVPATKKQAAKTTAKGKAKKNKNASSQLTLTADRTRDVSAAIDSLRSRFQLSSSKFIQLWFLHSGSLPNIAASLLANEKRAEKAKGAKRNSKSIKSRVTKLQAAEVEKKTFEWTIELDCLLHQYYMTDDEPLALRFCNALFASLPTEQHRPLLERNRFLRQFAMLVRSQSESVTDAWNLYSLEPNKRMEVALNAVERVEREANCVA